MNTFARIFAIALVLTGAAASSQIANASQQKAVVTAKTSAWPVPTCPPDDPNQCGMGQLTQ
jgi:hypothetical protein